MTGSAHVAAKLRACGENPLLDLLLHRMCQAGKSRLVRHRKGSSHTVPKSTRSSRKSQVFRRFLDDAVWIMACSCIQSTANSRDEFLHRFVKESLAPAPRARLCFPIGPAAALRCLRRDRSGCGTDRQRHAQRRRAIADGSVAEESPAIPADARAAAPCRNPVVALATAKKCCKTWLFWASIASGGACRRDFYGCHAFHRMEVFFMLACNRGNPCEGSLKGSAEWRKIDPVPSCMNH